MAVKHRRQHSWGLMVALLSVCSSAVGLMLVNPESPFVFDIFLGIICLVGMVALWILVTIDSNRMRAEDDRLRRNRATSAHWVNRRRLSKR